jgi:hypothetical protein
MVLLQPLEGTDLFVMVTEVTFVRLRANAPCRKRKSHTAPNQHAPAPLCPRVELHTQWCSERGGAVWLFCA